ncbi:hypothetical protein BDD43_4538 [Mucilaginibacter gracilis]|uniref:PIN domain-containing protein n=1 Tax=Mucilaginibacter gracilis TaxID=423350 RepID=A0A495J5N4_9SPHI|nr:hypothetical protein [Mucilaginibacter gracilis]RKR84306.1 hypothetical protein BDD43_4538 [Mucilaginibacter gracilis]
MTYYFDTNAVYNIRKVPADVIKSSFTSILTLIELISGIKDEKSYTKRKAIIGMIFKLKLTIDWAMPEEIVFNSFDFFDEDEFGDDRTEKLINLINCLIRSSSYNNYIGSEIYCNQYGHRYFKEIDDSMSMLFILRSELAIHAMKHSLTTDISGNTIMVGDQSYLIDTAKALSDFFELHPEMNRAITINGLANMLIDTLRLENVAIEDVFESYNGLTDMYVDAMSKYCIYKITHHETPAKNDFSDLTHILYMKNSTIRKMVSDDSLFKTYLKEHVVSVAHLKLKN